MLESVDYKGKIFAIVKFKQPNGEVWEIARRTSGVRMIIKNPDGTFKLSNEFRHEHQAHGYRLPGGKMFDDLEEYLEFRETATKEDLLERAKQDALREAKEELGIEEVSSIKFIEKSVVGSTVEWDLYVFEISDFKVGEQKTHGMEQIEPVDLTKNQILESIDSGEFSEDRIVPVLLRYLKNN
jgi:ADP-ribose pyrophosphatase YjhB (NUDIX family)